jgi:hypothetical protein
MSAFPKRTSSFVDSVAVLEAASSFITLVRVRSSMPCSSHHDAGRKSTSSRDVSRRR